MTKCNKSIYFIVVSCCSELFVTQTTKICWTDATASCANNDAMFTFLLVWRFSQRRTEIH